MRPVYLRKSRDIANGGKRESGHKALRADPFIRSGGRAVR